MLDYLLGKGFSINGRVDEYSLLYLAIIDDNTALADHLLAKHAKIGALDESAPTPLTAAIVEKHPALVKALLQRGANPNRRDDLGNTELHYAAGYSTVEIVQLLLDHGARIDVVDKKKLSPLYMSLLGRRWKVAELLMQRHAAYAVPGPDAFAAAVRGMLYESPASTLDMYLKNTGILRYTKLKPLVTAILVACAQNCSEEKMDVFLDNGINPIYAPKGKPLFRSAYEKKNIGAMISMIRHGYRPRGSGGLSPLERAVVSGDATLVKAYRLAEVEQREHKQGALQASKPN